MPRQKSDHVDSAAGLARRLRDAREQAGLSQRALAQGICTPAYVSRLEKGERIPSLQLLRRIAGRLGVDADELASGVPQLKGDPLLEAELALRLGETAEAEQLFTAALDPENRAVYARALAGLGEVALSIGDLETARSALGDALEEARSRGDSFDTFRYSVLLADALLSAGEQERANALLRDVVDTGAADSPLALARLWRSQDARRALGAAVVADHLKQLARAYRLLASVELDRGDAERSLELLDQAQGIAERTGDPYEIATLRVEQARALAELEQQSEAASRALEAAAALEDATPAEAAQGLALVADVFAHLGDHARATELSALAVEAHALSLHNEPTES